MPSGSTTKTPPALPTPDVSTASASASAAAALPSNAVDPDASTTSARSRASTSEGITNSLLPPAPRSPETHILSPESLSPVLGPTSEQGSSRFSLRHSRSAMAMRSGRSSGSPRNSGRPLSMAAAGQYAADLQRRSQPVPFRIGVVEDRNKRWRRTMEDSHTFVYDFGGVRGQGFFGVFDGHAGKASAEWCGKYLYQYLREHLNQRPHEPVADVLNATFQSADISLADLARETRTSSGCTAVACYLRLEDANGVPLAGPDSGGIMPDESGAQGHAFIGGASVPPHVEGSTTVAVVRTEADAGGICPVSEVEVIPEPKPKGFLTSLARRAGWSSSHRRSRTISANLTASSSSSSSLQSRPGLLSKEPSEGTLRTLDPATACLPFRRVLYTANVGDARAVLSRGGKAVRLTYDHKGSDPQEASRIKEAGGFVMNNRVNGVLAVTRSLGDNTMKEFVVGKPYTTETTLGDEDQFLIVACDGLWDVVSDQEAVDLIRSVEDAQEAARVLLKHALSNFSTDNISIMVIRFNAKSDTGFAAQLLS